MGRPVVVAGENPAVVEGENPAVVAGENPAVVEGENPEIRDFALRTKKGWRRGVSVGSVAGGGLLGVILSAMIAIPIVFSASTGIGIGVAVGITALAIAASEVSNRKATAKAFKNIFEGEGSLLTVAESRVASSVIGVMSPEISTDRFIGVINNLFEGKKIDADLKASIINTNNRGTLRNVERDISLYPNEEIVFGHRSDRRELNDNAAVNFLLLNSVVKQLMDNRELLPQVDRTALVTKFEEFCPRFLQHCYTRYPEKMTDQIMGKINAAPLAARAQLNAVDGAAAALGGNDVAAAPDVHVAVDGGHPVAGPEPHGVAQLVEGHNPGHNL